MSEADAKPVVFPTVAERFLLRWAGAAMLVPLVVAAGGAHLGCMPFDEGLLLTAIALVAGGMCFDIWRRRMPSFMAWLALVPTQAARPSLAELNAWFGWKLRWALHAATQLIAVGFTYRAYRDHLLVYVVAIAWTYLGTACAWSLGAMAVWITRVTRAGLTIHLRHPDNGGGLRPLGNFVSLMGTPLIIATAMLGFAAANPDLSGAKTSLLCRFNEGLETELAGAPRWRCPGENPNHEVLVALYAKTAKECATNTDDVQRCTDELNRVKRLQHDPLSQPFWSRPVEKFARWGFVIALALTLLVLWLPLRALYALIARRKREALQALEQRIQDVERELNESIGAGQTESVKGLRERLEALRADWRDCGSATWVMSRTTTVGIAIAQLPGLLGIAGTAVATFMSQ
jgi:hypothetical protein